MPRCFLLMVLASLFGYSAGQCGDVEETLADFEVRKYSVVSAGGFPSGLNCTWLMQSSNSANKMLYQIKNVELDADDFLNVYAGSTSSDPNVVSDFTGHSASRSLFRVDSPNILTTFQSRQIASTDAQNFDLYFMSGADQSGPSCVDQTLTAGETPGILTSPSFPAKYPTSTTCSWTIEAPASATLELTFLLIDIEDGNSGCNYDGLVVFLPGQKANPVVSQCKRGVWEPEVYSVNNNVVQLEFTADDGDSYAGFVLSYKAILPTTTPAPTTAAPPTTPTPGGNTGSDPGAGGCDVVSCVVPIVVIVVLVIAATIVVLFLVRKRRSKSEKYRPTAVDEPEVEVDQNEMKTVPDDAVA